ncbi:MAG: recombinase family protein [Bacilli bacterium]|jgi:site-specific DNA recombinase
MIKTTYKVGIYIRLSKEDEDKDKESESITNQRSFILDYLKENNYTLYKEYIDDGVSGTTFDRPAFNKMIADIKKEKINMVITKDMSRLGRDYINFGYYIEKFFPEHNVRYIAITDNVDTLTDSVNNDLVPFKALFNDFYAKDISKKIKASIITKKKQGLFLGTYAPYGYKKDPQNKYKLIVDPLPSLVVKRIYKLYLEGKSLQKIGRILTKEKIPKPSVYKKMNNKYNKKTKGIWEERTLFGILRNPNYTGNLFQNRRKKVNYKSKKIIDVPKEKWITAYNTHEAIIDMDTYERVQNVHQKNKLHHKIGKRNILLQGFIKCKECGHTIGINISADKKRYYTICNYYRKYSKQKFCTSHSMRYEIIEDIVLKDIRKMCKENIDINKLESVLNNKNRKQKLLIDVVKKRNILETKLNNNNRYLENSYLDKLKGIITLKMYKNITKKLLKEINLQQRLIKDLEQEKKKIEKYNKSNNQDLQTKIKEYLFFSKPNRSLLANIIDKITIDENKNIEIYYKIKRVW